MLTLNSPQVVQETALRWKAAGKVALVPTMGCLHEGHLSLVRRAKEFGQKVIVSIFVNPLQFGPNEDFEKYPRSFAEDTQKLEELGVDLCFHPTAPDLYPDGFVTRVQVPKLSEHLCGRSRPGHFDGVATVCLKLFQITQADFAVFGEKDFQQLRLLQQLTADLNLPLAIIPHETVRETDGLALSSRNRGLSKQEREWAARIPQSLQAAKEQLKRKPQASVGDVLDEIRRDLKTVPLVLDYVEIASTLDLVPASPERPVNGLVAPRAFVAVKAGSTRLIDNVALVEVTT